MSYHTLINTICTGRRGKFTHHVSYFNIAPKLKKRFTLMHPDFEANLITHIFRKFGSVGRPEVTSFLPLSEAPQKFHTVLSAVHANQRTYSIHSTASSLSMLIYSWNKIFYLLINVLHHHYVIDDVVIQNYCFFCSFSK